MGLIIKCKKTGTAYTLGYFGMFRSKVAELLDAELSNTNSKLVKDIAVLSVSRCTENENTHNTKK